MCTTHEDMRAIVPPSQGNRRSETLVVPVSVQTRRREAFGADIDDQLGTINTPFGELRSVVGSRVHDHVMFLDPFVLLSSYMYNGFALNVTLPLVQDSIHSSLSLSHAKHLTRWDL
jgi:hypothetical protein